MSQVRLVLVAGVRRAHAPRFPRRGKGDLEVDVSAVLAKLHSSDNSDKMMVDGFYRDVAALSTS
jgi:hypothetical protein